jgi:hypothetical protein
MLTPSFCVFLLWFGVLVRPCARSCFPAVSLTEHNYWKALYCPLIYIDILIYIFSAAREYPINNRVHLSCSFLISVSFCVVLSL